MLLKAGKSLFCCWDTSSESHVLNKLGLLWEESAGICLDTLQCGPIWMFSLDLIFSDTTLHVNILVNTLTSFTLSHNSVLSTHSFLHDIEILTTRNGEFMELFSQLITLGGTEHSLPARLLPWLHEDQDPALLISKTPPSVKEAKVSSGYWRWQTQTLFPKTQEFIRFPWLVWLSG